MENPHKRTYLELLNTTLYQLLVDDAEVRPGLTKSQLTLALIEINPNDVLFFGENLENLSAGHIDTIYIKNISKYSSTVILKLILNVLQPDTIELVKKGQHYFEEASNWLSEDDLNLYLWWDSSWCV